MRPFRILVAVLTVVCLYLAFNIATCPNYDAELKQAEEEYLEALRENEWLKSELERMGVK